MQVYIKIAASIIILCSSAYLGFLYANRYKMREVQLKAIQAALTLLEFDINFLSTPLVDALEKISRSDKTAVGNIFKRASEELKKGFGDSAERVWKLALEQEKPNLYLDENDNAILTDFSKQLGCGDRESQISNIRATVSKLKVEEDIAREESMKNGKMAKSFGFIGGIFIVLLLI